MIPANRGSIEDPRIDVVVETPMRSRNKYEYDAAIGMIRLDRRLPSATVYPADYGYVPGTLARDGDALDALVLVEEATFPGCVIETRILGAFLMRDEHGPDTKLITVPTSTPRWREARAISDVPTALLDEIEHFFAVYKDLEPEKTTETAGFVGLQEAMSELQSAQDRFRSFRGSTPAQESNE